MMLVVVIAGCGVRASDGATTAGPDRVPYDLLGPDVATTSTTRPNLARREMEVWFVANDRVLSLNRELPIPVELGDLLDALLEGPTENEATLAVRSALSAGDVIDGTRMAGGVATIDLVGGFADAAPREQLLALAQLVYTVTGLPEIDAVSFELDGVAIDVPRADGSLSDGPVSRGDYAALVR